jgi:glycosyltransferase involved in cell wall biosynthesis
LSARLLFVGEGPAEADLKARAARDALSGSVSFAGRLTPVELADRLRASRVYASFPKSEGVSASLLEAMATGLVPVVNALPANVEWVCDEENGLVVPNPPTVDDVATALRRAVEDVELAQRARTRNSTLVRSSASRSSNAHRFLAAFDELVRTSRGRET